MCVCMCEPTRIGNHEGIALSLRKPLHFDHRYVVTHVRATQNTHKETHASLYAHIPHTPTATPNDGTQTRQAHEHTHTGTHARTLPRTYPRTHTRTRTQVRTRTQTHRAHARTHAHAHFSRKNSSPALDGCESTRDHRVGQSWSNYHTECDRERYTR